MKIHHLIPIIASAIATAPVVEGAVTYSISGSTYSQNFDSLASSGANNAWTNDSTLQGWSLLLAATTPANQAAPTYATDTATVRSFGAYGAVGNGDRALGSSAGSGYIAGYPTGAPGTGSNWGFIAFSVTNNTGTTLNSFTVGYTGEQWFNGNNADTLTLEYGYGASFDSVSSWVTPGGAFNFTPAASATTSENTLTASSSQSGAITAQTWANGQTLWLRWRDVNASGTDATLAVDDFTFSAVPEPSVALLGGLGLVALLRRRRA